MKSLIKFFLLLICINIEAQGMNVTFKSVTRIDSTITYRLFVQNQSTSYYTLTNTNEPFYEIKDDTIYIYLKIFEIPDYVNVDSPVGPDTCILAPYQTISIEGKLTITAERFIPFEMLNKDNKKKPLRVDTICKAVFYLGYIQTDQKPSILSNTSKISELPESLRNQYFFLIENQKINSFETLVLSKQ